MPPGPDRLRRGAVVADANPAAATPSLMIRSGAPSCEARAAHHGAGHAGGTASSPQITVAVLAAALLLATGSARGADSLSVRGEVGTAAEVSNEQFYESAIDDTTFLGRRLHDSPESRVAVVAMAELLRSAGSGRWQLRFVPELSTGDEATRLAATATVRVQPRDRLRLALEPRAEYSRDDGFGMRRREWRAALTGRARLLSFDESSALRLAAGSEVVRALAGSDPFVLSGTSARVSAGWARTPLLGSEWDVEYGAVGRVFRDSTSRDQFEHRLAVTWRRNFGIASSLVLAAEADRRVALRDVTSSRDRFLRGETTLSGTFAPALSWEIRPEVSLESLRFDVPDSLLDFDYDVWDARLLLGRTLGTAWRVGMGPRAEWLSAPWNDAESYDELGWTLELERFTAASWWNVAPAFGRRRYAGTVAAMTDLLLPATPLHSDFTFVELSAFLDQKLPARMRVRALATLRDERHDDPDQDARSLYFSLDVRRLF